MKTAELNSELNHHSEQADVNVINVYVPEQPSVGVTEVNISSDTTIVELLQLIAQKHRLQIHTESFIFYVNEEDQKR